MSRQGNVKVAIKALRSARWRSFLTMLGIIIGVVSVVTTVSLGEGVKQQIRRQTALRGENLLTILPGQRVERNQEGVITSVRPFGNMTAVFSERDYKVVEKVPQLGEVAPFAHVSGLAQTQTEQFQGQIIATTGQLPSLLNQKVEYGSFFSENERDTSFAVIGTEVAEELFNEIVPIGKSFTVRDQEFVVRGIFEAFPTAAPLPFGPDYNRTIFVPYRVGLELMDGTVQIEQILAKPADDVPADRAAQAVREALQESHAGQVDFTVLTQNETLLVAGSILNLLTALIGGVAAISLIVGGIGIMNIMFVSVTERTAEIGIRKAIGATNRQILNQFLTEAMILGIAGGTAGVLLAVVVNFLLRVLTDLQPVITLPVMGIATLVSLGVGIIFGVTPALRAARKNPIDALRYE